MELDAYREEAETFLAELNREYYRHYAGLQDTYEIEPIYDRHRGLFTREAVDSLRSAYERAGDGGSPGEGGTPGDDATEAKRRARMLLDFAVEGYIGEATKAVETELARVEAGLMIDAAGRRVGFREAAIAQANEADPDGRAELEQARLAATAEKLGPLYRELIEGQHARAEELGWRTYREMCEQCKALDLVALGGQTAAFSAATEESYPRMVEPALRRTIGVGLSDLRRADLPRLFRAPEYDRDYPADRLAASFIETMRGLGIDVATQPGVNFDLEPRPNKSPRAFCAPVRVPGEVYLVVAPIGGRDDYSALFHEGGHTEHVANVDPALPFEFRYLGDNAITETYAFLMQHLIEDPEWLTRKLGIDDPSELVASARAERLVYLRRYTGKLAYELELHAANALAGNWDELADRYAQLLGAALRIEWPTETFLADVDPGFYCACYIRAWALETHLRGHLRERYGPAWFESGEAGEVLRGLWRDGQRLSPEELLGELTGQRLDFAAVQADLGLVG
jgi:hypothetical protein